MYPIGTYFCCFAAMSAVDRGHEISLSDRYFLLLKTLLPLIVSCRAQVAETTKKEGDFNRPELQM